MVVNIVLYGEYLVIEIIVEVEYYLDYVQCIEFFMFCYIKVEGYKVGLVCVISGQFDFEYYYFFCEWVDLDVVDWEKVCGVVFGMVIELFVFDLYIDQLIGKIFLVE